MDRRERKPILLGLLVILFTLGLVACGTSVNHIGSTSGSNENSVEVEQGSSVDEKAETMKLTIYYADEKLTSIVQEEHEIQYKNESEMINNVWHELQNPINRSYIAIWDQVSLLEARIENGTLFLDISISEELNIGSSGEGLAIQTLLQTYGQLNEIKSIQILVNGEIQETLAGHVTINEPIPTDATIYTGE